MAAGKAWDAGEGCCAGLRRDIEQVGGGDREEGTATFEFPLQSGLKLLPFRSRSGSLERWSPIPARVSKVLGYR